MPFHTDMTLMELIWELLYATAGEPGKSQIMIIGGAKRDTTVRTFQLSGATEDVLDLTHIFTFDRGFAYEWRSKIYCFGGGWPGSTSSHLITAISMMDKMTTVAAPNETRKKDYQIIKLKEMKQPRHSGGIALYDGEFYICGGSAGNEPLSSCDVYTVRYNKWRTLPLMSTPRHGCAVVECQRFIYVLGGWTFYRLNTVERYNPEKNRWEECPPMNSNRCEFAAVVIGRKVIYAIGGHNGTEGGVLSSVEKFEEGEWKYCKPMMKARQNHSACEVGGQIIVIGGIGEPESETTAESYDPGGDRWSILCKLDDEHYFHSGVPIP